MVATPDAGGDISRQSGNLVVLASDTPRTWKGFDPDEIGARGVRPGRHRRSSPSGGKLLRDDYAPVDQLLTLPKGI